jgi:hypothetical protein
MRARNHVQTELTIAAAAEAHGGPEPPTQRAVLGHRWMVLQDLDGYIALGDPAARLVVPELPDVDTARPVPEIQSRHAAVTLGDATAPPVTLSVTPSVTPPEAITASAIQAAVHDLIAGTATRAELAVRYGVSPVTIDEWRRVYTDAGLRAVSELVVRPLGS